MWFLLCFFFVFSIGLVGFSFFFPDLTGPLRLPQHWPWVARALESSLETSEKNPAETFFAVFAVSVCKTQFAGCRSVLFVDNEGT